MFLDNIPAFYYGTSPNKFFDYISVGIPVINNYPGWLAEIINHNRCGVVVPPDNHKALVDVLVDLASHPEKCKKMGHAARIVAEKSFSRIALSKEFCEFIDHHLINLN
jgi:glycosyltransferase involved in cell wall biosynthesis